MDSRPRTLRAIALCSILAATAAHAGTSGKEVAAAPPAAAADQGWSFSVTPYGWMTGLDGTTGVGSFLTDVDVDFTKVFEHLDGAFFLQAEARRGRLGILFDGSFAQLSGSGSTPGELYAGADFTLQQSFAELAVAWRLFEGKAGFVDVFAGARYNGIDLELAADTDDAGIRAFSNQASSRIIGEITRRAKDAVDARSSALRAAAGGRLAALESEIAGRISEKLESIRPLPRLARHTRQRAAGPDITGAIRELAEARVAARVASIRSEVRRRAEARVATAEKKLASAIERELKSSLPENVSARQDWVDPFVGLRGQWNFTDRHYLAGRADIGGFGVGSELTWQTSASVGWRINSSWSTELGYRYISPDYEDGAFVYEVASSGVFVSLGYTF